jgi:nicotinamidase-related amidase
MISLGKELYVGDTLLITDVQNDFLPGGVLEVKGQYHDTGSFLHKQILAGLNSAMTIRSYRDLGFESPTSEKT